MTPGQRAFFAGLAFSRAKGAKIDKVFSRFEYKLYQFDINIDAEGNVHGYEPSTQSIVRGKLPLTQFMKNARHFAFEGERDIFQGMDMKDMVGFRIDVNPFWCRFLDNSTGYFHYYLLERREGDEVEGWVAREEAEREAAAEGKAAVAKARKPRKTAGTRKKKAKV